MPNLTKLNLLILFNRAAKFPNAGRDNLKCRHWDERL